MQVYRQGEYWRADKAWCKGLQQGDMHAALQSFADSSGGGLRPEDVYGGASGAVAQLQRLTSWLQVRWAQHCCCPAKGRSLVLQHPIAQLSFLTCSEH